MAITDNCVAYWKLDGSSGSATDSSGSGFTLTNSGSVAYNSCLINNGADFGSGQGSSTFKSLNIANNCGIDGGNVTLSVWVNLYATTYGGIFITQSATSKVIYYIDIGNTSGKITFGRQKSGVANTHTAGDVITTSAWHYLVLTYDGTTLGGYIDNVAVTGVAASGSGSSAVTSRTSLGGYTDAGSGLAFAACKTDEAGIWTRVLDSGEVNTLYNGGAGLQLFQTPPTTAQPSFLLNFC